MGDAPTPETTPGQPAPSPTPVTEKPAEQKPLEQKPVEQKPAPQSSSRQFFAKYGLGVVAVLLVVVITLYFCLPGLFEQETDDAYVEGHVVSLMPKLPAYVVALHVDDNARVKAGDLLVELDQRDYLVESNVDQANLEVAGSKLEEAQATVRVARANADEARANVELAQASADLAVIDLRRLRAVSDTRAVSSERLDTAQAAADGTQAALAAAKKKAVSTASEVDLAQAQVTTAQNSVDQARALLGRAELNLSYTGIYAPISGTIADKNVETGDFVQPGQLLFSIVPDDLYVIANYKETQLKRMRPGQKVVVRVDAFPNVRLSGHIDSIQRGTGSRFALLPPENATGNFIKVVQRVPVKIVFDHPNDALPYLSPGMSVETRVYYSQEVH
jgi:membrane fusion protein, multidrug efflux system